MMQNKVWRWILGLVYIVAVAAIWIAASYVVQSVVDAGVSPFLITYICNSLFVVYIPIVEIGRWLEDSTRDWFGHGDAQDSEKVVLLGERVPSSKRGRLKSPFGNLEQPLVSGDDIGLSPKSQATNILSVNGVTQVGEGSTAGLDAKGRWTRSRVAKVSLLVCPFWFFAQLTFNLSLKYTTVTSNTILSSVSSLFTFLVSLAFLDEKFTWVKLLSVLLCMAGTIIVSLGDKESGGNAIASNPLLGDVLSLVSAALYAVYITLIRKKLPDEEKGEGRVNMAQFLGFLGLFNLLIFLPVALVLNFTKLEPLHILSWKQLGLVVGKGLLDNVLSDYLWAKAVLLTTTTVATAGLTIQVPLAAVVDTVMGHAPHLMDYLGGVSIMLGFVGINIPSDSCCSSNEAHQEQVDNNVNSVDSAS